MLEKGREKAPRPGCFLAPFWSNFPSKINKKIDAEIDAEKVMKIDEKTNDFWLKTFRQLIVCEKGLMQNNLLKPRFFL